MYYFCVVKKYKKRIEINSLLITDFAAEGKAIGRHEGKVIFTEGTIPGDVVDVLLLRNKKDWANAKVLNMVTPSADRITPFCKHFGLCGGCKWQMLPYEKQLEFKQQEATQNLLRIGKITDAEILPIVGADAQQFYRNKLEFTFSNKEYVTVPPIRQLAEGIEQVSNELESNLNLRGLKSTNEIYKELLNNEHSQIPPSGGGGAVSVGALGYHAPRVFDKTINIEECFLMDDVNNRIRNSVRTIAAENDFSYYDIKEHTGWLRNIILRYTTTGGLMVNLCINYEEETNRKIVLDALLKAVPEITTLLYTINPKWNDSIYDLTPQVYFGKGFVTEKLEDFEFIISPKSFFQTNTKQAEKLYTIARDIAQLTGN